MKKVLIALASLGALTAALPAQAALIEYEVSGTLVNGETFNGGFTVDDTKSFFEQYSNASVTMGGKTFNRLHGLATNTSSLFAIYLNDDQQNDFSIGFNGLTDGDFKIVDLKLGALNVEYTNYSPRAGSVVKLASGTVSLANSGAVPEPATWAMMMLGFGAVGYSLRRKTALRFV